MMKKNGSVDMSKYIGYLMFISPGAALYFPLESILGSGWELFFIYIIYICFCSFLSRRIGSR